MSAAPRRPRLRTVAIALSFAGTYAVSALAQAPRSTPSAAPAESGRSPEVTEAEASARVAQASVVVTPKGCAGVLVVDRRHVLTAAHCIPPRRERIPLLLDGGERLSSGVEYLDRERDLALLRLDSDMNAEPLELARRSPSAGEPVLFLGRIDRYVRAQRASVVRLGRCPSLPGVEDVVFTSLRARRGDSGAPIVDADSRVLAVVHGGAACHIAAPVHTLALALRDRGDVSSERTLAPSWSARFVNFFAGRD